MDKRQFFKTVFFGAGGFCFCNPVSAMTSEMDSAEVGKKWTKEALFYTETPKGLRCQICPNECDIKEGEAGDCRNRVNKNGKLYSIALISIPDIKLFPTDFSFHITNVSSDWEKELNVVKIKIDRIIFLAINSCFT